ncbi:2-hydroxychromene-2-carboxylate isomerase [Solirhodobacter olei]|uniref:2-hydroxychromene-2-carboxylate isomerase n=1 Tax=Solirhodobacter olei TaxID=2493082 RepID=UPI000FD8D6C5|nr:2-hydroxychromene-2-carboxylate isomerase [Solirhodobacter olei]
MAIDFWFSVGSTYSYLSIMRLDSVTAATGIAFNWRVFNVRKIMQEMQNVPFADKPPKLAYMWRDLERRAAAHGYPARLPAPYPISNAARANRLALLGLQEGWGRPFTRAVYRRWFHQRKEAGGADNLNASLAEVGQDPASASARADGPDIAAALTRATDEARARGIFGTPTFAVGGELFWGDDRLEDALAWHRSTHGR